MSAFINLNRNDNLAFLRGIDLQDLLVQVENFNLEYRDRLNLSDDLTFGVEIEYEKKIKKFIDRFVEENLNDWQSKSDASLNSGGEITSPIMTDTIEYWKQLKIVCDYLERKNADTLHNTGGHIHIGTCILGEDVKAWKMFLKLYTAYENVLFRFIYGDKISGRKLLFQYAPPIADTLHTSMYRIESAENIKDFFHALPIKTRYAALNFSNVNFDNLTERYNTLEFRSPNSTTNATIWQNNINVFAKMLISSRQKVMNEDFLDYKLKHEFNFYSGHEFMYNDINLKNVLEFVDLVFDNNLDKLYFLRQYLKNFQSNYGIKTAIKARKFVK